MIVIDSDCREVIAIPKDQESVNAKHFKKDSSKARHLRKVNPWPKRLRAIIAVELISVILACGSVYGIWCHNIEVRAFRQVCAAAVADISGDTYEGAQSTVKSYLEGIGEEVYEYVWTAAKTEYRTGPDASYKSAGTLEKDKMIRRTGIMHNGWSRISLDEKDYYIPGDKVSTEIPEGLPIADGVKGEYQKYALSLLPDFGWDSSELEPLIYLWNRESGWNPNSHNRSSGAHGIPQALPGSKMASEGSDYYTNPEPQIRWGLKYIASRYGSPSAAWAHFQSRGWY